MASFLSQPINFTPYTPSVDVNLYNQVGQFKQNQYNQGVAQAQSAIDNVAGLPIGRDIDKQYLQQKLQSITTKVNQLGSKPDFSDQRISGSITSAASAIANDSVLQSAVASTLNYKKQLNNLEEAKKAGKSGSANEWDFQRQAAAWQNGTNPGESFNGSYTPYRDVRKKALEVLKDLTKDSSITDDALTIDSSGKVVLSDAIQRTKLGGLSPQRLKAAIATSLDADDMHQLSIEGNYNYSNKSPEQLAQTITASHKADLDNIDEKINTIRAKAEGVADGGEKTRLLSQVGDLVKERESVEKDNQDYMDMIAKGNTNGASANYYTTNFLRNFSNSFSYKDVSQTYENNPMAQIQMERNKMEISAKQWQAKYDQDNLQFSATYEQKERHHKTETDISTGAYGKVNLAIAQKDLPDITLGKFQDQTDSLATVLSARESDFLSTQGRKGDKQWLTAQQLQYEKSPTSVTPSLKNYFDQRSQEEKILRTNQQLITQLGKDADEKIGSVKTAIPSDAPSIAFSRGGNTYKFTPEEIASYTAKRNKAVTNNSINGDSEGFSYLTADKAINDNLSEKEKALEAVISAGKKNDTEKSIFSTFQYYQNKVVPLVAQKVIARNTFINKSLADRTGESQRASFEIPTGKGEQRASVRGMVQSFIDRAKDTKESLGDGVDVDDLNSYNSEEKATYRLITKGKTQYGNPRYWMSVSTEKGTQQFEISEQDKRDVFGERYESETQDSFSPVSERLRSTNNGSTNFEGTSDVIKASANSFLSHSDFANVKNFNVKGDIYKQNGKYGLALYIIDPISKQPKRLEYAPPSGLMDEKQALLSISKIDDAAIYELMTGQKLTPEVLEQIQAENKKAH